MNMKLLAIALCFFATQAHCALKDRIARSQEKITTFRKAVKSGHTTQNVTNACNSCTGSCSGSCTHAK